VKKVLITTIAAVSIAGTASAASLKDEAQKLETQYVDAFNHGAPQKLALMYTRDGVAVAQDGSVTSGRPNLEMLYSHIAGKLRLAITLDQVHPLGNAGWALIHGSQTSPDGRVVQTHAVQVFGRENGTLKLRALSFAVNVPLPHKTAVLTVPSEPDPL
jgi:ketosteroid isomerase-like protein